MSKEFGRYVRGGPPATEKFDMNAPMIKQKMYMMPIVWAFSNFRKAIHFGKLNKVRMEGVKPPYILICNHNAFFDFYIMILLYTLTCCYSNFLALYPLYC